MPPRFTIRQVVGTYRRKAFGTRNDDGSPRRAAYPPAAIAAFYGMLELAEEQPTRGSFESERLLKLLLEGPNGAGRAMARQVPFLIEQGDLVRGDGSELAVDGWVVLQEGDVTVADRVARLRARRRDTTVSTANAAANGRGNARRNGRAVTDVTVPVTPSRDARATSRAHNAVATEDGGRRTVDGFTAASSSGDARDAGANGAARGHQEDLDELPVDGDPS